MKRFQPARSKMIIVVAAMAMTFAVGAAQVHATTSWAVPGSVCQPRLSHTGWVDYGIYGVNNNQSTAANVLEVVCPIETRQAAVLQNFTVRGFDRSSTDELKCDLYTHDSAALPTFIQSKGTGVAFTSSSVTSFGFTSLGSNTYGATLYCWIPAVTGSGASHLTTINYVTDL